MTSWAYNRRHVMLNYSSVDSGVYGLTIRPLRLSFMLWLGPLIVGMSLRAYK